MNSYINSTVVSSDTWRVQTGQAGTLQFMVSGSGSDIVSNEHETAAPPLVPPKRNHLSLRLYFSFVRSRFTTLEEAKIRSAVRKFNAMRFEADQLGQRGLYEQLSELLLLAVREQQLLACGFYSRIQESDITRYITKVDGKVEFCPLEIFPRPIPPKPARRLALARDRKLFDSYKVLFHPAVVDGKTEALAKTTANKIREKDPIVFGVFAHSPQYLYPVADWIDEHCDLTMEKMVAGLKTLDRDYELKEIKTPTEADVEALRLEVVRRQEALKGTNISNWREREAAEKAAAQPTATVSAATPQRKTWWQRVKAWFKPLW